MSPRSVLAALSLLSTAGCVAAVPIAARMMQGSDTAARICSIATLPGQTASLCEQVPVALATQPQGKQAAGPTAIR